MAALKFPAANSVFAFAKRSSLVAAFAAGEATKSQKRIGRNARKAQSNLGSARASRAGDGALAIANFRFSEALRRGAAMSTRGACAPQTRFRRLVQSAFTILVVVGNGPR